MEILIVDDSKIMQERLSELFQESEFISRCHQVFNVNDAISMLKKEKIDVVLTDIRMPGATGFDLLKYIKKEYPDVITIMITNYNYPQYELTAKMMGAEFFLSKSEQFDQIVPILSLL